eukprot:gb/GEZN01009027.1/.p1 GENE.gb/GEZN01009027.1/~~gb/GEZN01009027.1/.p1  ORF type:complete len:434 (+),score=22.25 gb/GEZN01009027.1/:44-1303(+)
MATRTADAAYSSIALSVNSRCSLLSVDILDLSVAPTPCSTQPCSVSDWPVLAASACFGLVSSADGLLLFIARDRTAATHYGKGGPLAMELTPCHSVAAVVHPSILALCSSGLPSDVVTVVSRVLSKQFSFTDVVVIYPASLRTFFLHLFPPHYPNHAGLVAALAAEAARLEARYTFVTTSSEATAISYWDRADKAKSLLQVACALRWVCVEWVSSQRQAIMSERLEKQSSQSKKRSRYVAPADQLPTLANVLKEGPDTDNIEQLTAKRKILAAISLYRRLATCRAGCRVGVELALQLAAVSMEGLSEGAQTALLEAAGLHRDVHITGLLDAADDKSETCPFCFQPVLGTDLLYATCAQGHGLTRCRRTFRALPSVAGGIGTKYDMCAMCKGLFCRDKENPLVVQAACEICAAQVINYLY